MVVLYTTHCPKCTILEKKLNAKGIKYEVVEDTSIMSSLGIDAVPVLRINEDEFLDYSRANTWVNNYEGGDKV